MGRGGETPPPPLPAVCGALSVVIEGARLHFLPAAARAAAYLVLSCGMQTARVPLRAVPSQRPSDDGGSAGGAGGGGGPGAPAGARATLLLRAGTAAAPAVGVAVVDGATGARLAQGALDPAHVQAAASSRGNGGAVAGAAPVAVLGEVRGVVHYRLAFEPFGGGPRSGSGSSNGGACSTTVKAASPSGAAAAPAPAPAASPAGSVAASSSSSFQSAAAPPPAASTAVRQPTVIGVLRPMSSDDASDTGSERDGAGVIGGGGRAGSRGSTGGETSPDAPSRPAPAPRGGLRLHAEAKAALAELRSAAARLADDADALPAAVATAGAAAAQRPVGGLRAAAARAAARIAAPLRPRTPEPWPPAGACGDAGGGERDAPRKGGGAPHHGLAPIKTVPAAISRTSSSGSRLAAARSPPSSAAALSGAPSSSPSAAPSPLSSDLGGAAGPRRHRAPRPRHFLERAAAGDAVAVATVNGARFAAVVTRPLAPGQRARVRNLERRARLSSSEEETDDGGGSIGSDSDDDGRSSDASDATGSGAVAAEARGGAGLLKRALSFGARRPRTQSVQQRDAAPARARGGGGGRDQLRR